VIERFSRIGEHFEVLEGELTVELDGRQRVLAAGDAIDVPRGTVHRMWNSGGVTARATWQVRPALRTAEMFAELDGGLNPAKAAKVLWRYRNEFRLATSLKG
jgi:glyoxylate utilization-related uncharacterized protein